MKAIILAAGMGTRLGKYTENLPKGMLGFNGKPLILWQVETLRKAGINDIVVVGGYNHEKINIPGVKKYINKDYANTNMVESLMTAEPEMTSSILVCYSDILYEPGVIKKVFASKADIGVTADEDYWDYWQARLENPMDDTESLVIDKRGKIDELGTPKCSLDRAKVRYVGLIKFSPNGVNWLKKVYHINKEKYFDKNEPWLHSKSFKKAYMTDMLQSLINSGHRVEPILIKRGWLEFDTVEDYENYSKWLKDSSLDRFFSFEAK